MSKIKVGNYTSHLGTSGATGGGKTEEREMLDYVKNYLNPLYQKDDRFDAYWWGDEAHEMDTDDVYIDDSFDLVMSHHMDGAASADARGAHMIYNQNPARVQAVGNFIGARIGQIGLGWRGNIHRTDLDMVYGDRDNAPRGLFELGFITNDQDRNIVMANKAWLAQLEYEAVCSAFGIKPLDGQMPEGPGEIKPPEISTPWYVEAVGKSYGGETVLNAYPESGDYHFNNAPHALSIYPDYPQAMENRDADGSVFIENGDVIVNYWAVVITDKYVYVLYTRDNGQAGCVSVKNKATGQSYGYAE